MKLRRHSANVQAIWLGGGGACKGMRLSCGGGRRGVSAPPPAAHQLFRSCESKFATAAPSGTCIATKNHSDAAAPASRRRPRVLAACKRGGGGQGRDTTPVARAAPCPTAEGGRGGRLGNGAPAAAAGARGAAARVAKRARLPPGPNPSAHGGHLGGPRARQRRDWQRGPCGAAPEPGRSL